MKRSLLKTMLLLCALIVGIGSMWAETKTVTYSWNSTDKVFAKSANTDDAVDNVTISTTTTGTSQSSVGPTADRKAAIQLMAPDKSGNDRGTVTLTLNSFPYKITGISFNYYTTNSNKSGSTIAKLNNTTFASYSTTSLISNSEWSDQALTVSNPNPSSGGETLEITAAYTTNSVYIHSFTVTYEKDNRLDIASINSLSPTDINLSSNGEFFANITPAENKSSSDYTVSYSTTATSTILSITEGSALFSAGSTKAYATVKVTVTPTSANESTHKAVSKEFDVKIYDFSANDGSEAKPFTVAEARSFKETPDVFYDADASYYVKGWVSKKGNLSTGRISYYISDNGTETDQMYIYRGKNTNNTDFESDDDIELEDYVVVYGKIGTRSSATTLMDGTYLTTKTRRPKAGFSFADEQLTSYPNEDFTKSVLNNPNNVTVVYSSSNEDIALVDENNGDVVIGNTEGTATITAAYTATTETPYKTTTASYKIKVARDAAGLAFPDNPDITTHANNSDVTEPTLTNPNNLAVTWASSDPTIATVDAIGQVTTLGVEGTTTITATYTQTNQYKGAVVSYNVTVKRDARTFAYDVTEVTLTKGETFTPPVFTNDNLLDNIVFTSTYNAVASVDATGAISLGTSTGVAIIKATAAQTDEYKAREVSVTITVNPAGVDPEPNATGYFVKVTNDNDFVSGQYLIVNESKKMAFNGNLASSNLADPCNYVSYTITNGEINVTNNLLDALVTIDKTTGSILTNSGVYISRSQNSNGMDISENALENNITFSNNNVIIKGGSTGIGAQFQFMNQNGSETFKFYKSSQSSVQLYKYVPGESRDNIDIYVSEAGLATYASNFALDYSDVSNLEAYIAKEENGAVKLQQVNKVPAGTGVLLRATDGGGNSYTVPTTTEDTDDVTDNLFKRGTGATVASQEGGTTKYNYILNVVDNVLGFYKANNQMVATNRAYLQTTISAASRIAINFDEASGIADVNRETTTEDRYYDMQGRQVALPTKGLYIVNGKKVVIK